MKPHGGRLDQGSESLHEQGLKLVYDILLAQASGAGMYAGERRVGVRRVLSMCFHTLTLRKP